MLSTLRLRGPMYFRYRTTYRWIQRLLACYKVSHEVTRAKQTLNDTAGITVLTQMTETYEVKEGDILLIHTVAGGLGLLFTAYAKYRGATVIGTTSTPEKAALAKSYGADHVILYPIENTVERVLEITNGKGVHAVYDGVGKDTYVVF